MDDIFPMWLLYIVLGLPFAGGMILFFYFLDWISKNKKDKK